MFHVLQCRHPRLKQIDLLQNPSSLDSWQLDPTESVFSQEQVYVLVEVEHRHLARLISDHYPPEIRVQRFQNLIQLGRVCAGHSEIQNTECSDVAVVFVVDELKNYLLRWLYLQHFQQQADKFGGPGYSHTVSAANVLQFKCSVD